jgi:hypothetical protein
LSKKAQKTKIFFFGKREERTLPKTSNING